MFFARKRSVNAAAATCFCLCESEAAAKGFYLSESKATAAKGFYLRESKATAAKGFYLRESEAAAATQHDIGHSVVATGRGFLRLSSSLSADVFCTESVATALVLPCR
ncbi:hypothetical protein [Lysinibacillus xylanilyticus]|uniref:hypothetical protein n=1 Tax=Lysinibacillus xylanilyticus TaxID=582475 RepID=UPI003805CD36